MGRAPDEDSDRKALYRAGGSIAFVAAARVVLVVAEHPDERDVRVVVQSKNNLAPKAAGLSYRVDTGAVAWGDRVSLHADDVLGARATGAQDLEAATTAADVITALRAESSTGVIAVRDAYARAELLAIPERTLRYAARRAGLVAYCQGRGPKRQACWFDPAIVPDTKTARRCSQQCARPTTHSRQLPGKVASYERPGFLAGKVATSLPLGKLPPCRLWGG